MASALLILNGSSRYGSSPQARAVDSAKGNTFSCFTLMYKLAKNTCQAPARWCRRKQALADANGRLGRFGQTASLTKTPWSGLWYLEIQPNDLLKILVLLPDQYLYDFHLKTLISEYLAKPGSSLTIFSWAWFFNSCQDGSFEDRIRDQGPPFVRLYVEGSSRLTAILHNSYVQMHGRSDIFAHLVST